MNFASYEKKIVGEKRAQPVPIGIPIVWWKTFPAKATKILSIRNSSILMMSFSEYLVLESECPFTKYVSSWANTKYLIILVSLFFSFSGEVWLYKTWKNRNTLCLLHG